MHTVGRYEIVEELGKGAMGVVYKATDPMLDRAVALKTMRSDVYGLATDEVLSRFRNEARAAASMSHPNIVTIYDAGEQHGMFYMAMEFIDGRTLASIIASRHSFSAQEVLNIARQVASALDFAHLHGVVHRDIKPANIIVAPDGNLKIMDFGIAKAGGDMTLPGQVMGTPNYMSPEQVMGKPLDGRSDLFSLGVILFEMLTGEKPFAGENVTTIIYKIVHEQVAAPRELEVGIHPGLSAVVKRALAKSPEERYQSGAELIDALQNYKSFASDATGTDSGDETMVWEALPMGRSNVRRTNIASKVAERVSLAARTFATRRLLERAALVTMLIAGGLGWGAFDHWTRSLHHAGSTATQALASQAEDTPSSLAITAAHAARTQAENDAAKVSPPVVRKATETGTLRLESSPTGALIRIDGRLSDEWTTPFTISRLKAGRHTVSAWHRGFASKKRLVEVLAGQQKTVHFELPVATANATDGTSALTLDASIQ